MTSPNLGCLEKMTFNTNTKGALQSLYSTLQRLLKVTAQYCSNFMSSRINFH